MAALAKVATLLDASGAEVPASALDGKVVGIYFSAHWCPPCRGFTPKLADWYRRFKASHPRKDEFEIVFASSDRDAGAFKEYFAEMPWMALPYQERDVKESLSGEFSVRGIPTLVFVDAERKLLTKNGRGIVTSDPDGAGFPWAPKSVPELLGDSFVNAKGETFDAASMAGKYKAIYFSAHWCPPCRGFTPELVATYKKVVGAGKPFEVIFASSDQDEAAFKEYLGEMPWLAIPYGDRKRKEELSEHFEVEGIPTLVILDPEGKVVNAKGRAAIGGDPEGADFPWAPKPLIEVTRGALGNLNDAPTLIAFTGGDDAVAAATKAMLQPLAEKEEASAKAAGSRQLMFMYSGGDDEAVDLVRDFAKLGAAAPLLVILDIPNQCKHVAKDSSLTAENVAQFVADYTAGRVAREALR